MNLHMAPSSFGEQPPYDKIISFPNKPELIFLIASGMTQRSGVCRALPRLNTHNLKEYYTINMSTMQHWLCQAGSLVIIC